MGQIALNRHAFDSGEITVDDSSSYVEIGYLDVSSEMGWLVVQGLVGSGGALAHLKITRGAYVGSHSAGDQMDILEDTDFASPNDECPSSFPSTPHTTAADGTFQLRLNVDGVAELGFWAKKATADTTLQLKGRTS